MRRRRIDGPAERHTARTVHFFRLHAGRNDDGDLLPYDFGRALERIGRLPFSGEERYLAQDDDTVLVVWPDEKGRGGQSARFATVRRAALPRVENSGQLTDLRIPASAGLAEITHVVGFADSTVGILFNNYGPRPTKIADYLNAKCAPEQVGATLSPLLRSDVATQLMRMTDVRLIDISVHHDVSAVLAEFDKGFAQSIEAARRFTEAQRVRIVLQPEAYSRGVLGQGAVQLIRNLARMPGIGHMFDRFFVRGFDPVTARNVDLDVLREFIVSKQDVVFLDRRSRALNDSSAYDAIRRAHSQLAGEIASAAVADLASTQPE